MASLMSPSSPNCLQLRSGLKCRESFSVFLQIRFRPSVRRIRLVSSAGAEARDGAQGRSWTNSNKLPDSFAGWSGTETGGGSSKKKGGFGGIVGAGLAGIFLVAGVTFASLSLSSRSTSGVKQQMEPLTSQQEALLASDDQIGSESNVPLPGEGSKMNDCNSDCETGTSLVQIIESAGDSVDAIHRASNQEDPQVSPDVDYIPVPTGSNPSSTELSSSDVDDFSSDPYSFKDSQSIMPSATSDLVVVDENLETVNPVDSSSLGIDSTNLKIDHQEGSFIPTEKENSKVPLVFSDGSGGYLPRGSLTSSLSDGSDATVDSQTNFHDIVETVASDSMEQDIEQSDMLQLPSEASSSLPIVHDITETVPSGTNSASDFDRSEALNLPNGVISSPPEGHNLNENKPFGAHSASVLADPNKNELRTNGDSEIDRSSSLFESLLPENSFSYSGIPAPTLISAARQVPPGKVLIPPVVDQVQGQALAALQALKVIEADVQPGDICTRREYARWLVSGSNALSRNAISKVYPAMYIENATELAFDDVTPEDPDFTPIQGLAEAGLISSKLSRSDFNGSLVGEQDPVLFSPESPLSRQDLVSWKMALEKRQLPEVDRKFLYQCSGYLDIDKINPDAWPALAADLSAGEQGITALAFGYTRLFQPDKPVTKAHAAIALATGDFAEVVGEEVTRIEAESLAETAVNAHTALVAEVEKDLNASFAKELAKEREKIDAVEKLAEEARLELERLRKQQEEENNTLIRGRAAVDSEMDVLSRLRHEVEEQLQSLMSNKMEISFERDRINKLRKEAESENQVIVQLQYELEVERKALSMARAWAEEEAKRAREQARALEEARERWERHGIKVVVDGDLRDDASAGMTWVTAGKQHLVDETINRAENLVEKLKSMAAEIKIKSSALIEKIIEKIEYLISALKQRTSEASKHAMELRSTVASKARKSIEEFHENASGLGSSIGDRARRAVEDCRESVEKITHKFKT